MKEVKKNVRKAYFISQAVKILKKEGLKGFSARKVAKATGYNVASIYTYFENLTHLENLASIYFISDYVKELTKTSKDIDNSLVMYINTWILFSKHSMLLPEYFYNVFFAPFSQTEELNIFKEYYELFEDERPRGKIIQRMMESQKTVDRESYLMSFCKKDKIIKEPYAKYIAEVHVSYFKCILTDMVKDDFLEPSVSLFQEHILNFIYILYHYVDKIYTPLLDDIIAFYNEKRETYENFFDHYEKIVL